MMKLAIFMATSHLDMTIMSGNLWLLREEVLIDLSPSLFRLTILSPDTYK